MKGLGVMGEKVLTRRGCRCLEVGLKAALGTDEWGFRRL